MSTWVLTGTLQVGWLLLHLWGVRNRRLRYDGAEAIDPARTVTDE